MSVEETRMSEDIAFLSADELARRYGAGSLTPIQSVEAALARLARLEPVLNAFQRVDAEGARQAARLSAERWRQGAPLSALDGVPVTVKDTLLARGFPTLNGSRTVDPTQGWREDAPEVARLREAGAVLLGKTTTPEFGWKALTDSPLKGVTRSPWNPELSPGGSSGGAAASLAAGIGALALGTDGGGSIRIPASHCGLVGLKPTQGLVPHYPHKSPFGTLTSSGPLARSVADAALLLNELAKPDSRDVTALPARGARLAPRPHGRRQGRAHRLCAGAGRRRAAPRGAAAGDRGGDAARRARRRGGRGRRGDRAAAADLRALLACGFRPYAAPDPARTPRALGSALSPARRARPR